MPDKKRDLRDNSENDLTGHETLNRAMTEVELLGIENHCVVTKYLNVTPVNRPSIETELPSLPH